MTPAATWALVALMVVMVAGLAVLEWYRDRLARARETERQAQALETQKQAHAMTLDFHRSLHAMAEGHHARVLRLYRDAHDDDEPWKRGS